MKLNRLLLVPLLGLAPWANAARPAPTDVRAEVLFLEPEKFTDVKDSYMSDDVNRTTYLDQLRDHLIEQARSYVPMGAKLAVTFTDIDLAGDFEPWRGPRFDDIRIVKDIYPPRLKFSFRLIDAEGNVVKQGDRDMRDMAFQMKITMGTNSDTLRYEKGMLDDWMRSEFPRLPKNK
ncbi:MAG TPA: DUF3016 domain-containing protein [Opitutaceae bacterium]|nr:DUF3016 domain-containing protein [Opitutaceae bacterium]